MSQKYAAFDKKLFQWLHENRENVTTSQVMAALQTDNYTLQRHISRRFTQLEDRGVLQCTLEGTTRVCSVVKDLPETLAKQRWRPGPGLNPPALLQEHGSVPAKDSLEFEAAGGTVQRLASGWDHKPSCNAVGMISIDHVLAALD